MARITLPISLTDSLVFSFTLFIPHCPRGLTKLASSQTSLSRKTLGEVLHNEGNARSKTANGVLRTTINPSVLLSVAVRMSPSAPVQTVGLLYLGAVSE